MTELLLAIDQGTTGSTALLVTHELELVARSTHEFPQHFPHAGWVEHDPEQLWLSVCRAIADVMSHPRARTSRVAALGITNQRETTVVWRRHDGQPIHRALVWQDRRTADMCTQLREHGHEPHVRARTGLVLDPYFSATKLAWILDAVPHAREHAQAGQLAAGTIDSYLLWRLTGGKVHATEPSNASRTSLWPLGGSDWDDDLCALFRVPKRVLPQVLPCTTTFGTTRGVANLPDGIPICGIAGDQQAALFGQVCHAAGEAKCTYGTGAFVVLNTGTRRIASHHGLLTSVAWQIGNETTYCVEGSAFMAGAIVQWLRDGLGFFARAADIEPLARSVESSDGVVLVPAHTGLGAPHWRPEARGLIRGLTRGTTRAHIARAALEGIALEVADLVEAMATDLASDPGNVERIRVLKVDGGAAANDLLMQIQCDLLGIPISRPSLLEATALGAVLLAGLGAGVFSDLSAARAAWREDTRFSPSGVPERLARLRTDWKAALAYT